MGGNGIGTLLPLNKKDKNSQPLPGRTLYNLAPDYPQFDSLYHQNPDPGRKIVKQPAALLALIMFIAGISFVLSAQVQQRGRAITVTLAGTRDPLTLYPEKNQICYESSRDKIGAPGVVNIQSAGSVVISLRTPCSTVERPKIEAILQDPSNYYIDVQN